MKKLRDIFSKKNLPVLIGLLVVLIILYYFFSNSKKALSFLPPPDDSIGGDLTEEDKVYLNGLAINLYNDMNGLNWQGHEMSLYEAASNLGDNQLVALSNIFNYKFQAESGYTFVTWLDDETFELYGVFGETSEQGLVDGIINRLQSKGVS